MCIREKLLKKLLLSFISILFFTFTVFADIDGFKEWDYAVADFNGDGFYDVLVVSTMGRGSRVWFNNGAGEFYPSGQVLGVSYVGGVTVADLDGDNDEDIFIVNLDSPDKIWLNDNSGYFFESGQEFSNKISTAVALGDIDSDGDADAAVAYANGGLEIFSNNGAGIFFSRQIVSAQKGITSFEFRDINNDNSRDILCFIHGKAKAAFINNGNSDFTKYEGSVSEIQKSSKAALDLTGDDRPDWIYINNEGEPSVAEFYRDEPMDGASGGPDSYGYVWVNNSFSWSSATGSTWTASSEDSVSGAIPLGFTFNFYGTDYTAIYITSDGYIQFSDPYVSPYQFWPEYCNSTNNPNNAVYGFATDLDPTAGGRIYYQMLGSAPNRYFVVTWYSIFTLHDNNDCQFQIILYETTNHIRVNYRYVTPDYSYASVGIESAGGAVRLLHCHLYCYPPDQSSLIFYPAPEIDMSRSGISMPTGSSYNYGYVTVGSSGSVTFTITNTGRANLNISSYSITGTDADQFSITSAPSSPVAPLGGTTDIIVTFQPTSNGEKEAQLQINNDDLDESTYVINLYGGGDDDAPTVTITYPADGATVSGTEHIDADAADDVGVNSVRFYMGNRLIGTDTTAPYSITHNFDSDSPGIYTIRALVSDTISQTGQDTIQVTNSDAGLPVVNITEPANGANITRPTVIKAEATDDTEVIRVDFYLNGRLLCSDMEAPYECIWNALGASAGSYTIKAVATDNLGLQGTDEIIVKRRVAVDLAVTRQSEKVWIVKKDYAEITVTLPDYGVADVAGLHIIRKKADGGFESVKILSKTELVRNSLEYLDKYLESGITYSYKVIIVDSNWLPIGESSIIVI